jgi:hypothetical protein
MHCYGELFRGKFELKKFVPGIDDRYLDPDYRRNHALEYLDAVEALTGDVSVLGFKLMINQDPKLNLMRRLVAERGFQVILLYRENLLAQFASEMLAKKTGQGAAVQGQTIIRETVPFDEKRFLAHAGSVTRNYEKARNALRQLDSAYLELEYLQLADNALPSRIADFLGVPAQTLESPNRKRSTSRIIERFDDPEEVRGFLEDRGLGRWVEEYVSP